MVKHLSNLPVIKDIRGTDLLICVEFTKNQDADKTIEFCLQNGLLLTKTQNNMIRIFPALNITEAELQSGLEKFIQSVETVVRPLFRRPVAVVRSKTAKVILNFVWIIIFVLAFVLVLGINFAINQNLNQD